jgi:hypothetical protein
LNGGIDQFKERSFFDRLGREVSHGASRVDCFLEVHIPLPRREIVFIKAGIGFVALI